MGLAQARPNHSFRTYRVQGQVPLNCLCNVGSLAPSVEYDPDCLVLVWITKLYTVVRAVWSNTGALMLTQHSEDDVRTFTLLGGPGGIGKVGC